MIAAPERSAVGMSLEQFLDENGVREFELINGERIYRMPTVIEHNDSTKFAFLALHEWVVSHQLGVVNFEATFTLSEPGDPNWVTGSFTPDVMFIAAARFEAYTARIPDYKRRPYFIVPDVVVEVISPTDRATDILEKITAYRTMGVRLLWVIYPRSRTAFVYTPDSDTVTTIRLDAAHPDAALDGSDVLPGFALKLADVLA